MMQHTLLDYLHNMGFKKNPFAEKTAEDEEELPRYFVVREYFGSVLGTPSQAATTLYFASRGKGKTAMARMVYYLLTQTTKYGSVLVVNFGRDAFEELLDEVERDFSRLKKENYRSKLLALAQQALSNQWKRLQKFDGVKPELLDHFYTARQLKELALMLHQAGISSIYFLIDGVDELLETAENAAQGAELILPMLADLSLLETHHLAFKFFLPLEFKSELRSHKVVRLDRFEALTDRRYWSEDELQQLFTRRLEVLSGGRVTELGPFSDTNDIDVRLCRAALGSPRNLLRLGSFLLDQHLREGLPPKISEQSLNLAIQQLHTALKGEGEYKSVSEEVSGTESSNNTNAELVSPEVHLPIQTEPLQQEGDLLYLIGNDTYIGKVRLDPSPGGLELKLLRALYEASGKTCDKDSLIKAIYADFSASDEQLNATVKRLRKKLKDSKEYYIETVRGVGFRLCHFK